MIGFLVWDKVRIKIRFRVRVKVGLMFNISIYTTAIVIHFMQPLNNFVSHVSLTKYA